VQRRLPVGIGGRGLQVGGLRAAICQLGLDAFLLGDIAHGQNRNQ